MKVILGVIVKTFGIKGEVKVHSNTDFAKSRYKKGNVVTCKSPVNENSIDLVINGYKKVKGMDVILFEGYDTPESVEKFIGYQILIEKPENDLKKNEYYYADLLGCSVFNDGIEIGKVIDIFDSGINKILRIQRKDNKDLLYPFIENFISNVDIGQKRIDLLPIKGMLDL